MEVVYYLRARVEGASPSGDKAADFYIVAEDQPTAGAMAHDICSERGWKFAAYLALPQPVGGWADSALVARAQQGGYALELSSLQPG
jgi:hypothetical protein